MKLLGLLQIQSISDHPRSVYFLNVQHVNLGWHQPQLSPIPKRRLFRLSFQILKCCRKVVISHFIQNKRIGMGIAISWIHYLCGCSYFFNIRIHGDCKQNNLSLWFCILFGSFYASLEQRILETVECTSVFCSCWEARSRAICPHSNAYILQYTLFCIHDPQAWAR